MFGRKKGRTFSYTKNVSAHSGVTIKKKTIKKNNNKKTKYSQTNNERVHRDCGFWIPSIVLLSWISEIREKQKQKQTNKKTENRKNLHQQIR